MSEYGMSWRTLSVRKILRVQEAEMSTLLLVEVVEKVEATLPKVQEVDLSTLPKVEKVGPTCPKWRWRSEIARVQITGSVSSSSGGASQQPSLTPQPDDIVYFLRESSTSLKLIILMGLSPGVEFNKLSEETVVWSHVPMLPHLQIVRYCFLQNKDKDFQVLGCPTDCGVSFCNEGSLQIF